MINFSENAVFNLQKIDNSKINNNAIAILIGGEEVVGVYKTIRD